MAIISQETWDRFRTAQQRKAREDMEKGIRHIQSRLTNEELFRVAYIPFVISRLVWDYADTILDLCALLRLPVKKLCRTVRELRQQYDRERSPFIDRRHKDSEERNMYVYERRVAEIMKLFLVNLTATINREHPDLKAEHRDLLIAVYQCRVLLRALLRYSVRQTSKAAQRLGWEMGDMLPDAMHRLEPLVIEFAGDCPLTSKDWQTTEQRFVDTFANQIALVELTSTPDVEPIFNEERAVATAKA